MEWNRIESKWHEMARRLQCGTPVAGDAAPDARALVAAAADALARPEGRAEARPETQSETSTAPAVAVAGTDEIAPRAMV